MNPRGPAKEMLGDHPVRRVLPGGIYIHGDTSEESLKEGLSLLEDLGEQALRNNSRAGLLVMEGGKLVDFLIIDGSHVGEEIMRTGESGGHAIMELYERLSWRRYCDEF